MRLTMTRPHKILAMSAALVVVVVSSAAMHPTFVPHLFMSPQDLVGKVSDEMLDFDDEDEGEGAASYTRSPAPTLPGLPNFGFVTETIYRGAQPTAEGYGSLQRLGVQIVVDFRRHAATVEAERQTVEAHGMQFVNIPWRVIDQPEGKQVAQFLRIVQDNPDKRIFAHCEYGRERTGVMVAAFRMAMQHWTPAQAQGEMRAFGFRDDWRHFWNFHLEEYVEHFPQQLATDPELQGLQGAKYQGRPEPGK
jgi:protein tyrosine phosphatase (PTP) superfamily phosphohydrolase (DUF442 family)